MARLGVFVFGTAISLALSFVPLVGWLLAGTAFFFAMTLGMVLAWFVDAKSRAVQKQEEKDTMHEMQLYNQMLARTKQAGTAISHPTFIHIEAGVDARSIHFHGTDTHQGSQ
jgi:hypothetical protein